ncbi:MAG: IS110 family transposase [Gammaproteobacteria bacterium]|nr:IS110 family transposase [Gammaproteobacteria bacterium]
MNVTTIGIDLAKSVFQLHGVDAAGEVVFRRKLRRSAVLDFLRDLPACLIGVEACATAHFWAREIGALGHEVRLIPPAYVKPYVKRQKNDAADAEAICEAVTRPNMRFVPIKSAERQGVLMLHRTRDLLMRQRTMTLNAVRAHLAEFGIITAQGPRKILTLIRAIQAGEVQGLPPVAATALESLAMQLDCLADEVHKLERQLMAWHRADETSQRLETIPGIGIITATALAASVPDPSVFKTGRQFAAFLGLVPRQSSSGGKDRLGRISKMGDGYLRRLLVVGATSVVRRAGDNTSATGVWLRSLLERKPARLVTVAVANKTARIAWAVLARGETYRAPKTA